MGGSTPVSTDRDHRWEQLPEQSKMCRMIRKSYVLSSYYLFLKNKFIYFIYLFLVALALRCCVQAFSSCGERGLLFVAVRGLLIAVASLVAEHRL